jgi:hypothetical protein
MYLYSPTNQLHSFVLATADLPASQGVWSDKHADCSPLHRRCATLTSRLKGGHSTEFCRSSHTLLLIDRDRLAYNLLACLSRRHFHADR